MKEVRLLGALDLLGSLFEMEQWDSNVRAAACARCSCAPRAAAAPPALTTHDAQETVFEEGAVADKFYIITRGAVKFTVRGHDSKPVLLNILMKDDYFGEIGARLPAHAGTPPHLPAAAHFQDCSTKRCAPPPPPPLSPACCSPSPRTASSASSPLCRSCAIRLRA